MDLENGGACAANNLQQVQPQQGGEEEAAGAGDDQLATPDPAADYLRPGEMAVLCVLAVVLSAVGALLVGLAFGNNPIHLELELDDESGQLVFLFQSDSDGRAFVAELTSGVVALGFGCASAAILALRCCTASNSFVVGL